MWQRLVAQLRGARVSAESSVEQRGLPAQNPPEHDPELGNDQPDSGEVVWGWVAYEDDPSQGKDRPVLVLQAAGAGWLGLMLSSQDHDRDASEEAHYGRYWMDVGSGGWDPQGRPSEVRLDRLILLEPGDFRREGSALDEATFAEVVEAASAFHDIGVPAASDQLPSPGMGGQEA